MTTINGTTDARFAKVKEAFAAGFADGLEHGASVAVVLDGKPVVELWGGHADKARQKPWAQNTLVNVWSCTKAIVATAVAMAVERGQLQYEKPVASVWPEFAAEGKGGITLDHVMSHRAGLNGLTRPVAADAFLDWDLVTRELAAMAPVSPAGAVCAYHALTYGHLAGEALRRATGLGPGRFIAQEIAGKLGADFHVGVPEAEDPRCAAMIAGPKCDDWLDQVVASPFPQACQNPRPDADAPNHRRWRAAEVPGGNGHGTALGLATIMGDLARARPTLMSGEARAAASALRFAGTDQSFQSETRWAAGFHLGPIEAAPQLSAAALSHGGWGGSQVIADPAAGLGFAFVTNRMLGFDDGVDPRRQRLLAVVYAAL